MLFYGQKRSSIINFTWSNLIKIYNWQIILIIATRDGKMVSVYLFCCCCPVTQLCLSLCYPMDCSMPGLPAPHYLLEFVQVYVHWISDAIQQSHPLSSPSPPALNLSQHQGLFQWVSCWHQMAKILELQRQHQSFQWLFRADFLQDWLLWSP